MEQKQKSQQKRCASCGRYFRPDNRVGDRQQNCKRFECQKERTRRQQARWRKTNAGYFTGRYEYLKEWRKAHPDYQKSLRAEKAGKIQTQIPPLSPIKTIRLNIRADQVVGEIQTLVLTLVKSGQSLWLDGARMQPG